MNTRLCKGSVFIDDKRKSKANISPPPPQKKKKKNTKKNPETNTTSHIPHTHVEGKRINIIFLNAFFVIFYFLVLLNARRYNYIGFKSVSHRYAHDMDLRITYLLENNTFLHIEFH